jgi:hypothetical protein
MIEVLVWPGLTYDAPVLMPYFLSDTMTMVLFWVLVPYDVLVVSRYFWVTLVKRHCEGEQVASDYRRK